MSRTRACFLFVSLALFLLLAGCRPEGNGTLSLLLTGQVYPSEAQLIEEFEANREVIEEAAALHLHIFESEAGESQAAYDRLEELGKIVRFKGAGSGGNGCDISLTVYSVQWQGVHTTRGYSRQCDGMDGYATLEASYPDFFFTDVESIDAIEADFYQAYQYIETQGAYGQIDKAPTS